MKAYTEGPWTQGRTLLTGQTSQWTEEQWNQNEAIENRMVFANFSNADKGISRVRVATCETKYDAMLIAAAPEMAEYIKSRADAGCERAASLWRKCCGDD